MIMRLRMFTLAIALASVWCSPPIHAHHSYAATYDQDKPVEISGVLVMFMYRNPHSVLQLKVLNGTDEVRWACEWAGTRALSKKGVGVGTLKPGDQLVVSGIASKNSAVPRLLVTSIYRPKDGWRWSGDSME
jgi:hypothetical protein